MAKQLRDRSNLQSKFVASARHTGNLGRASPWSGQAAALLAAVNPRSSYAARPAFEAAGNSQSSVGGPGVACFGEFSHRDVISASNKENNSFR